jgi:hypothetical protein
MCSAVVWIIKAIGVISPGYMRRQNPDSLGSVL